jgi:ketosteroid isomerase-like protein
MTPKEIVVRYVEAVAKGDLAMIIESFAPDVRWIYPGDVPLSGTWTGRDAVVNDFLGGAMGALFAAGGAPVVALVHAIAEGDQVVAEWTSKGVATNGMVYDNRCAGIYTVRDGQITEVREYADTQHVARVLFGAA